MCGNGQSATPYPLTAILPLLFGLLHSVSIFCANYEAMPFGEMVLNRRAPITSNTNNWETFVHCNRSNSVAVFFVFVFFLAPILIETSEQNDKGEDTVALTVGKWTRLQRLMLWCSSECYYLQLHPVCRTDDSGTFEHRFPIDGSDTARWVRTVITVTLTLVTFIQRHCLIYVNSLRLNKILRRKKKKSTLS